MPTYEYRCKRCDDVFELDRPMSESSAPATCPEGHKGATRVLSVFATVSAGGSAAAPMACGAPSPAVAGCGGGCACH